MPRIGFASTLDQDGIAALHRAAVIFARKTPERARWGRAEVKGLDKPDVAIIPGTGVAVAYGDDEDKVARMMVRPDCLAVLVVLGKEPKATGPVAAAADRVRGAGREVQCAVVKARGTMFAVDLHPSGVIHGVEDLDVPFRNLQPGRRREVASPLVPVPPPKAGTSKTTRAPSRRKASTPKPTDQAKPAPTPAED